MMSIVFACSAYSCCLFSSALSVASGKCNLLQSKFLQQLLGVCAREKMINEGVKCIAPVAGAI